MRAAIYARQSIDAAEGIARQVERCRSLVAARGWEPGAEYLDNDTSASKARGEGTGWARMLADAGQIDVVVAVNLDRLLRTQRDLVTLLDAGIRVVTLEGEIDLTTASGELQASVLTSMARFEARRKAERQVRANDHRARNGKVVRGRRPFGFEPDGVTVRPAEAAAVQAGYAAIAEGQTLAAVARSWNEAGLTTGQGGAWAHHNVRHVLLNPRYRGAVRRHGEIVHEGAEWPALVDAGLFREVEAILRDPARRRGAPQASRLLSGIALCGVCREPVHAGGGARRGVANYRCSASTGHLARMAEPVDEHVRDVVCAFLQATKVGELLAQGPEGDALATEADELRSRLDALALDYAEGALTSSQLRVASERLRERLAAVEARMLAALRSAELGDLAGRPDVRQAWDALTLDRRRRVLRALPLEIVVHPPGRGTRTFRPESVHIGPRRPH
jgi:site-specific DNA recombinase